MSMMRGIAATNFISGEREALVQRMADDLVAADAFASLADAIRLLMWKGYGAVAIAVHADDARQVAMQSVVAPEMMKR